MRTLPSWWLCLVTVLLGAGAAQACPSCVDPNDAARSAMLGSTIVLSLVPLAFIGAVVAWIVQRERAAPPPGHTHGKTLV